MYTQEEDHLDYIYIYRTQYQYVVYSTRRVGVHESREGLVFLEEVGELLMLTLLEPQSRFGDKPVKFHEVCPQNGTAVLTGFI